MTNQAMELVPVRYVRLLALLTIVAIAFSVTFLLWGLRDREINHARMETVSLTQMLMEQTEQNFESVDLMLQGVQERLQTPFGIGLDLTSDAVHLLLSSRVSGAQHVRALFILDESGVLANSSREISLPFLSMSDRDYFKVFAEGEKDSMRIGKPVRSRLDSNWILNLSRPLFNKQGKFRGVVVAAINIVDFERIYGMTQLDYVRPVGFYLADGTLIASLPHRDGIIGDLAPELNKEMLPTHSNEVRTLRHLSGNGEREVFAIGHIPGYPLLVSVTDDEALSLAAWRETAIPIALGAALVCIFTGLVAVYLIGKLEHKQQLANALTAADERYQHTINSVMDAIVAADESMNIVMFNPSAEAMFGYTEAQVHGKPLEMLIPSNLRSVHAKHVKQFSTSNQVSRSMAPQMGVLGLRSDGTEFPVESTISRSMIGGKLQITAVLRDVTERRKTEHELLMVNSQLRELSASLQNVREEERTRISRELHDDLGQQLTGLKLSLSWLGSRLKEGKETAVDSVLEMRQQMDAAITSVRRIAAELRPRVLDDRDFREALTWQMQDFFKHSGIQIELDLKDADQVTDDVQVTALFRIVQEALTNVVRHAQASKVLVSLQRKEDDVVLRITDNGHGFDVQNHTGGVGLVSMRERCGAIGASFRVESSLAGGTQIEVTLPLHAHIPRKDTA